MKIQLLHFSMFRVFQRLWALGLDEEKPQTDHSSQDRSVPPKLAVFIDFENFNNGAAIRSIFDCLAPRWTPICRRAYGLGLVSHRHLFRDLGISPIEIFHNTTGKNAADIALVIDVMTELSPGRSEAFCIVSGDGDFTRLAMTIREWGFPVIVYGPESTPDSLRAACTEFHLLSSEPMQNEVSFAYRSNVTALPARKTTTSSKSQAELIHLVLELASDTGKTTLGAINGAGCKRDARFCSKLYGGPKLSKLLIGMGLFDLSPVRNSTDAVQDYEVRPKSVCTTPATTDSLGDCV